MIQKWKCYDPTALQKSVDGDCVKYDDHTAAIKELVEALDDITFRHQGVGGTPDTAACITHITVLKRAKALIAKYKEEIENA